MSHPHTVIGLSGLAGAGKDTAADLLVTHCGFRKVAFADALRNEVAYAFGLEPLYLIRRETKEHPMSSLALRKCLADGFVGRMMICAEEQGQTIDLDAPRSPRTIMQWWGTEYRSRQDQGYWVRQTRDRIAYLMRERQATRIVVTDVRFPNEVNMIRTFGGQLWQIRRAGVSVPEGAHQSEVDGSAFGPDAVLNNDADIRHLQGLVLGEYWAYDSGLPGLRVEVLA